MSESPRARAMIISGTAAVVCGILSGAILAIRAPGAAATTTAQPAAPSVAPEVEVDEAAGADGPVQEASSTADVAGGDAAPPVTAASAASAAPATSASASPGPPAGAPPPRKAPAPKKSPVLGF